jgi:hypothetical protein
MCGWGGRLSGRDGLPAESSVSAGALGVSWRVRKHLQETDGMLRPLKPLSLFWGALLSATVPFSPIFAAQGDTVEITATKSAWMRTQPDRNSAEVVALPRGTPLLELGRTADWVHVQTLRTPHRRGWVYASLVDVVTRIWTTLTCKGQDKDLEASGDGNVDWKSISRVVLDGKFCFERSIDIKSPAGKYLVNWPKANFNNVIVNKTLMISAAKYDDSTPSLGDLEYGYYNTKISTKVYRGRDEPMMSSLYQDDYLRFAIYRHDLKRPLDHLYRIQAADPDSSSSPELSDEKSASVFGSIYAGGTTVYLALSLRSGYRDISEGRGERFEYFYNIANEGDEVIIDWSVSGSRVLNDYLIENAIEQPIHATGKEFILNASGTSSGKPLKDDSIVDIILLDGTKAMRLLAPAYVPRS